jgi:hypothetical protein
VVVVVVVVVVVDVLELKFFFVQPLHILIYLKTSSLLSGSLQGCFLGCYLQ